MSQHVTEDNSRITEYRNENRRLIGRLEELHEKIQTQELAQIASDSRIQVLKQENDKL